MADSKITALASISTATDPAVDPLVIVDVSDTFMAATGTTKKVTLNNLLSSSPTATGALTVTGLVTAGSASITGVSTFAAGTALLPALTTTGDTNTGIYYPAADTFAVTTGGAERYRVDSGGNLVVGTTSALSSGSTIENLGSARQVLTLKGDSFGSFTCGIWNASTTNDTSFLYFGTETSLTVRGSVTYNRAGGLVAYNVTSDYRAKDIIGPVSNSGSLIDSLKVYFGKMKGATIARPMLIAHEAQEVAPYAVTGVKDEVDADGKDKYQQMDVSSFVPLLIAEIQSLRTRVQTLEAR